MGYPHPDHLLDDLTARQWGEWVEFNRADPIGEERADLRAGILAATIVNCTPRKKGAKPARPGDFMPDFESGPRREQSPEEQSLALRRVAFVFGAAAKPEKA